MILKAAWVAPVTSPPIRGGFVEIAGDRIVAVGRATGRVFDRGTVEELGDVILTPGLVNPHTHLELTCYAGCLEPGSFWSWLEGLVQLRRRPGQEEREQQAIVDGAWQSLGAGVTCVGDISRRNLGCRALKNVPIRKVCFVELLTLADHPPRNPDELEAAVAAVEEDDLLTVGLSPHAPYTVPADQIRRAIALADRLRRPWCMHWVETREEVAFLRGEPRALPDYLEGLLQQCGVVAPGCPPMDFLDRCCAGLRPGALAHANYSDDGSTERLAAAGHVVIYCPRAHRFFGHPPHPLTALRAAGVPVAVGTDSLASNASLALLDELRCVAETAPNPPPPESLLRMATIDAARALGLHEQIGSIELGKQADLAGFPCSADKVNPLASLISGSPSPTHVWVAGRLVTSYASDGA